MRLRSIIPLREGLCQCKVALRFCIVSGKNAPLADDAPKRLRRSVFRYVLCGEQLALRKRLAAFFQNQPHRAHTLPFLHLHSLPWSWEHLVLSGHLSLSSDATSKKKDFLNCPVHGSF